MYLEPARVPANIPLREAYIWTNIDEASSRRDFESVMFWLDQLVIHRQELADELPVIGF